ncbi:type VI secretion system lipoprotein TssJ [Lysobacter arvi]|uniref:Type VI secretion system lipoprotein TssJ n=1 Tax=Lysobacter arvi TaxID=3038776 RepID=A0ABU1CEV6_9GAMM|nr:type VI secretion system lipoprotein TssJ [Lysobacter arvi]MDR0183470.1 type VI secretion system lipoprotein TssJ [Lysobacter arvi]
MSSTIRPLLWLALVLVLVGCGSFSSGRKDPDERASEVELALYATEHANPNPDAPVETDPAKPPIRIELSGDSLDDMTAQLAAMAKLIEQERKTAGSGLPEPLDTEADDSEVGTPEVQPEDENGETAPESATVIAKTATNATAADHLTSTLPGLPPSAVLELHAPTPNTGGDATVAPRTLGTYRGEDAIEMASPGTVTLRRGQASPLAIQVVQLSDDSLLLNADYDALAIDLKKALGSTYLRHDDYVLKPGQYKTVPLRKLDKDALYIGVIAAYHEFDLRRWKAVYRLDPTGHRYGVLMVFDEEGAAISTEVLR